MTSKAQYEYRPWLSRIRLNADDGVLAREIVTQWLLIRKAASRVARAIRLYDQLLRGETELLQKEFPWAFKVGRYEPLHTMYLDTSTDGQTLDVIESEVSDDELNARFMKGLGL